MVTYDGVTASGNKSVGGVMASGNKSAGVDKAYQEAIESESADTPGYGNVGAGWGYGYSDVGGYDCSDVGCGCNGVEGCDCGCDYDYDNDGGPHRTGSSLAWLELRQQVDAPALRPRLLQIRLAAH
ncbi:uncharacterized protein MONBRDRAFT_5318 [Monosiga brevicollis MX1]|uniref:Uncharacterized protein n=1 Tax=Monosiga brevicollis TaxID=81824 RepID=A9UQL7_MONBE|nr:uncharacterized protein MONBRDRAFT_5318 [Monosiga brevicollis MX1]EDQ92621.1 predicted protein [Monosiga brevicollis MX1]|eukprot:XP_001742383.1 hypothetical protein [Monosiga brevicollis MX1]